MDVEFLFVRSFSAAVYCPRSVCHPEEYVDRYLFVADDSSVEAFSDKSYS